MVYHHLNTKYYVKCRVPLNKGHTTTRKELLKQQNYTVRAREKRSFTLTISLSIFQVKYFGMKMKFELKLFVTTQPHRHTN